jgi:outer membrane lipoprotein LolB
VLVATRSLSRAEARPASRWRRASGLAVLLLAAGCATLSLEPGERIYTGRFAASVSRGEQIENVAGRFSLAIRRAGTTLDLASPLGNTLARLQIGAGKATLTAPQNDGSRATWEGDSPEMLTEAALGFRLPVSGLADWIAGRAAQGRPSHLWPGLGPPRRIEQDGWIIVIDERFDQSDAPRRLTFDRPSSSVDVPSVRLRLVVDEQGATTGSTQNSTQ